MAGVDERIDAAARNLRADVDKARSAARDRAAALVGDNLCQAPDWVLIDDLCDLIDEPDEPTDRPADPELAAMTAAVAALEPLAEDARRRVLRWAEARYAPSSLFTSLSMLGGDR